MYPRLKPLRRALALAMLALTGGLAVGVPLLDARETFGQPGVEEQHDASRCSYQHNHNLCVVFQQTPAEATLTPPRKPLAPPKLRDPLPGSSFITMWQRYSTRSARAPPVLL